ncbi:Putative TrmH family tRNA/rRNA methyltransferase [Lignipirellula cremea]|uniref:TrmH family tRNA/rRNA methyltransferase n=2 Tax=Lignipirellula cremea TaxID=2528010 RepID=A0A518DP55_9BACT|nr:Putative TrmH family tRNA/rRNA methyltransferase [Lignipirellula cremea]
MAEFLTTLDDPRAAPYRDLPDRKSARQSGLFIAEGRLLVKRLLASRFQAVSLLLEQDRHPDLVALAEESGVKVFTAERSLLTQIIGFQSHAGALACGKRQPSPTVQQVVQLPGPRTLAVLPNVFDAENVGSVLRTSLALGADAVLLGAQAADPFRRRVLRCSMGAPWKLPVVESLDLAADLAWLHSQGFEIIGAALQEQSEPLESLQRQGDLAILFGHEHTGLDDHWLAACHRLAAISMHGRADSLNIAVAAGIFLHHFLHGPGR